MGRATRDEIVAEMDRGSQVLAMCQAGMITREEAIAVLRVPWYRRLWERIVGWFQRKDIMTCGMGVMSRRQYREMRKFARESGNTALLLQLKRK